MSKQRRARASLAFALILAALGAIACTPNGSGASTAPAAASTAPAAASSAPGAASPSAPAANPSPSAAASGGY